MDALQARILGVLEAFQGRPWIQGAIVFVAAGGNRYDTSSLLTLLARKDLR